MENTFAKNQVHVGKNIQKFRLIREKSQLDLAVALEEKRHKPVSQQLISDIENRQSIDDTELLQQIAEILKVDAEVLQKLDLDSAINIISNTFTNNQFAGYTVNNNPTFNKLETIIELFEKETAALKAEIERLKNAAGK